MNAYAQELRAKAMVAKDKGTLAMDESNGTCTSDWLKQSWLRKCAVRIGS